MRLVSLQLKENMKTLRLLGLVICIAVLMGCTSSGSRLHAPVASTATQSRFVEDILIVSAVYGSGMNFDDVSSRVNRLIHSSAEFLANPHWLLTDPTPGWNKALVIVFEYKGKRSLFTAGEGGRVSADLLVAAVGN
jgi:hypothetical protein